jgi:hypothetical protein
MLARPANPQPGPSPEVLIGNFASPGFGKATITRDGDRSIMTFRATGAALNLQAWNGNVFTATLVPAGRFAAVADSLGRLPLAFVQLQMDYEGKPNILRLSFPDDQSYDFHRTNE